jgi:hypothetical protein
MLIDYLPSYYNDSKVFSELLKAFANEINSNNYAISDLGNQLFVDTATWGLDVWEKQFAIYTDLSKPYQDRREVIKAKMRGFGTCTIEMIENTALSYTNAEIEVIENNPNYSFAVKFVSMKGIPRDINAFKNTLDAIKPAHLAYTLEYTYTVWNDVVAKTWAALSAETWDSAKII